MGYAPLSIKFWSSIWLIYSEHIRIKYYYKNIFFFACRDTNITAVDIDPSILTVATDYFGLQQDNRLKVVIDDGIEFLKKAVKNGNLKKKIKLAGPTVFIKMLYLQSGQSYKAVLLDVDSKDPTLGMSCPPVQFLEQEVLDTIKVCIRETGNNYFRNIFIIASFRNKSS